MIKAVHLLLCLSISCSLYSQATTQPSRHPNVRAITAFVRVDATNYKAELDDSFRFLKAAKQAYTAAGWTVQTVRVTTQPFPEYTNGMSKPDAVQLLMAIDAYCGQADVSLKIGPAVMRNGDSLTSLDVLGEVLLHAKANASALVATEEGINWPAIQATAHMLKYVSEKSPHSQGTFNFAMTAMMKPETPFYRGSYHTGRGKEFAVGVEGAGLVAEAFGRTGNEPDLAKQTLHDVLTRELTQVETVAQSVAASSGWGYVGIDSTPAPLMDVSIGAAIEKFTGKPFGSSGTMTAAAIITSAQKDLPIKQVGYAGLMLPVLEDKDIAKRWSEGRLTIDMLLAYSAVCATGLDTVPLPGDVTEEQLARIYGDVASLAFKWKKQLTARLQPVQGRHPGQMSDFDDPYLVNTKLMALP